MTCPKCSGFCITDTELDYSENKHGSWAFTKCLMCGWATDPVMEQNRALILAGARIDVRTKAATSLEVEL